MEQSITFLPFFGALAMVALGIPISPFGWCILGMYVLAREFSAHADTRTRR